MQISQETASNLHALAFSISLRKQMLILPQLRTRLLTPFVCLIGFLSRWQAWRIFLLPTMELFFYGMRYKSKAE
jgi:hypothetical protein